MRPRAWIAIARPCRVCDGRPSRWTHRVGVTGGARRKITPTRNAIGLSRPMACGVTDADGRLIRGVPSSPLQGEAKLRNAFHRKLYGSMSTVSRRSAGGLGRASSQARR